MVSPCSSRKKNAETTESALKTSPQVLVAGQKPLAKHKFYLELKSQHIANRLQTQIQDLGGTVEFCLTKDVTCLVTDKDDCLYSKGVASKNPHDSHARCSTKPGRPKNRADAMLERAGCQPAIVCNDPLDVARKWGITVWSVEKAFTWLDKVQIQLVASANKRRAKVFSLKRPFVKFEAFDRKTRPVFKEIQDWPVPNWNGSAGSPAFVCRSQVERNMTRKTRLNRNDTLQQPGYCEVCRVEYSHLDKHLASEKHRKFVSDNGNFIELDALIDEGAGIESFLKLHCASDKMCDSDMEEYSPPQTRKRFSNRANSLCGLKRVPLSPTSSEFGGHRLRSRTHVNYVISTPTEEDFPVKPEGAKEARELRSKLKEKSSTPEMWDSGRPKRTCTIENEPEIWCSNRPRRACTVYNNVDHEHSKRSDSFSSGRPKRSCTGLVNEQEPLCNSRVSESEGRFGLRRSCISNKKRVSADERLVVDNRTYYKVEVMNNKLRSSGASVREMEAARRIKSSPIPEEGTVDDKGLIVKFRKIRNSELTFLNSEAENFLFPRKDDTAASAAVSEGDPDADGPDTTVSSTTNHDSTALISSERDDKRNNLRIKMEHEEHSMDSSCSDSSVKKKKRRTHAEAFILDNQKYYKFETPGSRLRYQGSFIPAVGAEGKAPPQKSNGDCTNNTKESEGKAAAAAAVVEAKKRLERESVKLQELQFSFERVPNSEPWFETFQRQDRGEEHYHVLSDPEELRHFLLPYQLPPLPPLDPKVCVAAYQIRKKLLESSSASTSVSSATAPEKTTSGRESANTVNNQDEDSKTSTDTGSIDIQAEVLKIIEEQRPKKRGPKKKRGLSTASALASSSSSSLGKHPRKSPRQHASTLAILSSLVQHRRRKGLNKSSDSSEPKPNVSLPSIPEEPKEHETLESEIERMLTDGPDVDEIVVVTDDEDSVCMHYEPDVVDFLESYDRKKDEEVRLGTAGARKIRRSRGVGRRPLVRKRKKNRTGWPNRSNRRNNNRRQNETTSDEEIIASDVVNKVVVNKVVARKVVREDSTDYCAEVVVAGDLTRECVNVDLEKWESAERVLGAKLSNELSPVVRVEKLEEKTTVVKRRRLRSARNRAKSRQRQKSEPRSPRVLRKPRGRWYRER